jgi:hypothetical protein
MKNIETTPDEEIAAAAILRLAEGLQQLVYYTDDPGLPSRARTIFTRSYRDLKQAVDLYFDDSETPLVWTAAPGKPFTKRSNGVKRI